MCRLLYNCKYCVALRPTIKMSAKKALVLLSEGSEEMEFVIVADVLRRAGIDVTVAGVQGANVLTCSRKIKIQPDVDLNSVLHNELMDVIVLPGGLGGAKAFCESKDVGLLLQNYAKAEKIVAAICAAPLALKAHNIAVGSTVTCYPSLETELMETNLFKYSNDNVVVDGKIITSRGPGTAFDFALTIVKELLGVDEMIKVKAPMLL